MVHVVHYIPIIIIHAHEKLSLKNIPLLGMHSPLHLWYIIIHDIDNILIKYINMSVNQYIIL